MDSTLFYQPTENSSNRIGEETVNGDIHDCTTWPWAGYECRRADVAFVDFDSGVSGNRGLIARTTGNNSITIDNEYPRWRVVSEESDGGEVGEIIVMVGRTTGTYTPVISRRCVYVPNELDIVMECQNQAAAPRIPDGDSGAPIFKITNTPQYGDVRLYGIFWGSNVDEIIYSPMGQIQAGSELGSIGSCASGFGC